MSRFQMETTLAVLGEHGRSPTEEMPRHNRAIKWLGGGAFLLVVLVALAQLPDIRLRTAGACHRHLKSGEWVSVDESSTMSDSGFSRLADEIVRNGTYDVLSISGTRISDDGFASVANLTMLDWIQLSDCDFSDAALRHLHDLAGLHTIRIHNCPNISPDGIADLQNALPNCRITYNSGEQ